MPRYFNLITLFLLCCTFTACESLYEVSIDNMVPGKFNFVAGMDSVAVVNNTIIDTTDSMQEYPVTAKTWGQYEYIQGDPKVTTEAIAHALADQNFFKQVMICDSALRMSDTIPYYIRNMRELNHDEVLSLCSDLHSNVLISLDNILIEINRKASFKRDDNNMYWSGMAQAKVYPVIRIYTPKRSKRVAEFVLLDSIAWEDDEEGLSLLKNSLPSNDTIKSIASDYAGYICKNLIPNWTSEPRYFYANGMSSTGQYIIYLINNEKWDKVQKEWEDSYKGLHGKQKVEMAYNLALANEMNNNIKNAQEWVTTTISLASKKTKYKMLLEQAYIYSEILKRRADDYIRLNMQMKAHGNN